MPIFQGGIPGFLTRKSQVTTRQQQQQEKPQTANLKFLPVENAQALLASSNRRQEISNNLHARLGLSPENHEELCNSLLKRFAEFVQNLPETATNYYARQGGLLDHALERTDTALTLVRGYFLPDGSEAAPLTEPQTLWMYAVYSASILRGIGRIMTEFRIDVYNRQGGLSRKWQPYDGSMLSQGKYYQYHFVKPQPDSFMRRNTLLLARQLMPVEGFRWISGNSEVLRVWLALLDENDRSAGTFGHVISQADAQAILREWQRQHAKVNAKVEVKDLDLADFDFVDKVEKELGKDKLGDKDKNDKVLADMTDWIRRQLASGELLINRQHLLSVPGGLLITAELFSLFVQRYPEYKVFQSMQSAFGTGQHLISGGVAGGLATYTHTQTGAKHSGMVLHNANLVLPETFRVATAQNVTQTMTAGEFAKQSSSLVAASTSEPTVHQLIAPDGKLVDSVTATVSKAPASSFR
jgi:integrating conjugative element relaxase (TIGR03760 family)